MMKAAAADIPRQENRFGRSIDRMHVERLAQGMWAFPSDASEGTTAPSHTLIYARNGRITVRQDQLLTLEAGCLAIARESPFSVEISGGAEALILRLPADIVGHHRSALNAARGMCWSAAHGTANLVSHLLNGVAEKLDGFAPRNPGRLVQHVVGFIALLCTDDPGDGTLRENALSRAQRHIEDNLSDPDLGPESIARSQNVSTRSLHRFFEGENLTVRGWIRIRRLEHCRLDLEDAANDHLAVSAIAGRWGLWDAAHFSRTFKARYGESPRTYRAQRSTVAY